MSTPDFSGVVRAINELWNTRFNLEWTKSPDGSYVAQINFEGDSYQLVFQRFPNEVTDQSSHLEGKDVYNFAFTRNGVTDVESRGKIPTKVLGGIFNEFESFLSSYKPDAVTVTSFKNDQKRMRVYLHAINKMIKNSDYRRLFGNITNPVDGSVYVVLSRRDVSADITKVILDINTKGFVEK